MTLTPEQLRAEIADVRADIAARISYLEALETALGVLTGKRVERIVRTMDVQAPGLSGNTKRAASRARKSEAHRLLYERNETMTSLAAKLGETRSRVSKWFGAPGENRPIPRRIAERLLTEYGIPLSAWSRIGE